MSRFLSLGVILGTLLLGLAGPGHVYAAPGTPAEGDDVTVIAVIDDGITPYHWDYLASKMPQATDTDPSNDLALDRPPHEWLRGFPSPSEFSTYSPLRLRLEERDADSPIDPLYQQDLTTWEQVQRSSARALNYYWMPGTKIIGAIDFIGQGIYQPTTSHGTDASSVAVGNIHGSCSTCLLVFLDTNFSYDASNAAIRWAESQPWIDAITNSYGKNLTPMPIENGPRDGIYFGETENQRAASERGQTIFFAAHNGVGRDFYVPTFPLLSSEAGPDWVVTVGAISPTERASYSGHGKPADISSLGSRYPAASGAISVGGSGFFSGTSNATPVIAGMYGQSLYEARKRLAGPSRVQRRGVIAVGAPIDCGSKRSSCELGDGRLSAAELRTRLFHGAIHTSAGMSVGPTPAVLPPVGEDEFLNEGHGSYFGLMDGRGTWREELDRIVLPMLGTSKGLDRPEGEREWMIVDSFCRQHLWGSWTGGYYRADKTSLPGPSPLWPLRSTIETSCPFATTP